MLARKNRISRKEFPSFKVKGTRFFSTLFSGTIYLGQGTSNVSVVVSKKTAKRAVDRNLLRRQFYSTIEKHLKTFTKNVRIVFYPKKEAINAPFPLLQKEMENALREANLIL